MTFRKIRRRSQKYKRALKISKQKELFVLGHRHPVHLEMSHCFAKVAKAKHLVKRFRAKSFWESVGGVARQYINNLTAKLRSALFANFLVMMKIVVSKDFII